MPATARVMTEWLEPVSVDRFRSEDKSIGRSRVTPESVELSGILDGLKGRIGGGVPD